VEDAVENVHGTAIALGASAVLIRGASGSGKSDLALRCLALAPTALIASPAMLVADDRVVVTRSGDRLRVEAPATIRGKLEVRGVGILSVPYAPSAELALLADLVAAGDVERLPEETADTEILGLRRRLVRIEPFAAAAPIKLLLALARANAGPKTVV
jgi:serine kinase of HPr protein (carbohydrate metabolism regulator)